MRITIAQDQQQLLADKAHKLTELKAEKARVEKEYEALKKEIHDQFISANLGANPNETTVEIKISDNEYFKYDEVATTRFDTVSFNKENPELKAKYTKSTFNKVYSIVEAQ